MCPISVLKSTSILVASLFSPLSVTLTNTGHIQGCKNTLTVCFSAVKWTQEDKWPGGQTKHVWSEIFPRISKHNVVKFAKSVPLYSPVVQIVISGKSFSISFPLAVTKRWANGECLKQAVHLALGCTCPFSAPAGPCPQLARPLSADSPRWQTPAEQSQALCGTVWDVGIVFDVFGTI